VLVFDLLPQPSNLTRLSAPPQIPQGRGSSEAILKRSARDGRVGPVGYEIGLNRYFYQYTPPHPLDEIEVHIHAIESEIARILAKVTGNGV
jgi:hypothetical protein